VCVWTIQFTNNERMFISMAWLPKATVQAAIGSVALDVVKESPLLATKENILLGQQVLTMAVLAILVTAPIGAALIAIFGPKLLDKEKLRALEGDDDDCNVRALEESQILNETKKV
jgi:NhaP-type Na+/H+ or K+/H+ antiporter